MENETIRKVAYTLEDRLKIKSMIDQGCSMEAIAVKLGRTAYAIGGEIRRRGGKKDRYDPYLVFDDRKARVPYTLQDRKLLEECLSKKMTRASISKLLNRSIGSINHEIKKNGGIDSYIADQAHDNFIQYHHTPVRKKILQRIENIEFQLEIITSTLQEILNGKNN